MRISNNILLFIFSNDSLNSLNLDNEWKETERVLSSEQDKGSISVNFTPNATLEDVFEKIIRFHNKIVVFHYAGHSDQEVLNLRSSSVSGKNLATIISQEERIKLVFLNGCSNSEQAKLLLEKGVPAVIATKLPIEDKEAVSFSKYFYAALMNSKSLKRSFEFAAVYVADKSENRIISARNLAMETSNHSDFGWELFYNKEEILEWKLLEVDTKKQEKDTETQTSNNSTNQEINVRDVVSENFFGNVRTVNIKNENSK